MPIGMMTYISSPSIGRIMEPIVLEAAIVGKILIANYLKHN
jgi:hypothetical protein